MHHSRMTVKVKLDDLLAMQSANIAAIGLLEEQRAMGTDIDRIQDEIRQSNGIIRKYDPLTIFDERRSQMRWAHNQRPLWQRRDLA